MSTVNLGNVQFSASFNTAGLDNGVAAMRRAQSQANKTADSMGKIKAPPPPDTTWIQGVRNMMKSLAAQSTLTLGPLSGVAARFHALNTLMSASGVAGAIAAGAIGGVTVGLFGLASGAIKASMQLERASLALKAVTGSALEAQVQIDFVRKASDQAGVSFTASAKGWARYQAAAQTAGFSLEQTKKTFLETSLAAGTLSLGAEDTAGVFKALEQIMSKGTVQAEELRGQLGDRFPGAFSIAAKAVGKTTRELGEMMKKGEVISKDFVPAFTAAMAKVYNIDVSKPIDSLQASLNRATNAWTFFLVEVDKAFAISAAFKRIVEGVTTGLNAMAGNLDKIKAVLGGVMGAFAGFVAATATVWALNAAFIALTTATFSITGALAGARAGVLALNAAMMATPLGWIGLIVRAAAVIGGYVLGMKMADQVTRDLNKSMVDTTGIKAFITEQKKLRTATAEATAEMIKQAEVGAKIADTEMKEALRAQERARAAAKPAGVARTQIMGNIAMGAIGMETMPGTQMRQQSALNVAASRELTEANKKVTQATIKWNEAQKTVIDLMNIAATPVKAAAADMSNLGDKTDKAGSKGRDSISGLLDTIKDTGFEIEKFKRQTEALKKGVDYMSVDYLAIDSMYKAQDALSRIEPGKLPEVDAALKALGYTSGTTTEKLSALFLAQAKGAQDMDKAKEKIDQAKESLGGLISAYTEAWRAKELLEGRTAALQEGGTAGAANFDKARAIAEQTRQYENLLRKQATMTPGMDESKIQASVEAYRKLLQGNDALSIAYDRQAMSIANAEQAMMQFYNTSMNALLDVILEGKSLGDTLGGIGKALARMAIQIMVLEPLGQMMRGWVQGTNAQGQSSGKQGWGAMAVSMGMKMFGFAQGGYPPVGQASIVGENGPELFVPQSAGRILPNHKLGAGGGGGGNYIDARTTIDARGASTDAIALLEQKMAIRDARLRAELPILIDSRSRESRMRGRG